jgi:hypothetical protein
MRLVLEPNFTDGIKEKLLKSQEHKKRLNLNQGVEEGWPNCFSLHQPWGSYL